MSFIISTCVEISRKWVENYQRNRSTLPPLSCTSQSKPTRSLKTLYLLTITIPHKRTPRNLFPHQQQNQTNSAYITPYTLENYSSDLYHYTSAYLIPPQENKKPKNRATASSPLRPAIAARTLIASEEFLWHSLFASGSLCGSSFSAVCCVFPRLLRARAVIRPARCIYVSDDYHFCLRRSSRRYSWCRSDAALRGFTMVLCMCVWLGWVWKSL